MNKILDKKILEELLADSKQSANDIAKKLGVKSALVNKRIRYFENHRIIDHYSIVLNRKALKYSRLMFFRVLPKTMLRDAAKVKFLENIGEDLLKKHSEINFLACAKDALYGTIQFSSKENQSETLDAIAKHPHVKHLGTLSLSYTNENADRLVELLVSEKKTEKPVEKILF